MTLYHFTCDHGRAGIGRAGVILPNRRSPLQLAWATDLDHPTREQLGLTSITLTCDRMAFRYRILDASAWLPWHTLPEHEGAWSLLDLAPGAAPEHWWVTRVPSPARLDLAWMAVR